GPIDLDGSVGFVLAPRGDRSPQQSAFQLGFAASYWFARPDPQQPRDQLRLQLEALYQFAQDTRFSTQATLLAGLLGMSKNGFGGRFAVGPEFIDQYVGVRVMGGVQFSWGPHVRNPWAEKKAAEPKETPAWIWTLLGAIDPILREDGCVWTDPTPRQASYKWFCIGTPDPQNPNMILLDSGGRLPIGTHLWEHGTSLRINDGTKVAEIPLTARLHKAVLDYVDGLMRHDPDPKLCEGKIDPIPQGIDAGWASVVANDDFGGRAAVLGMQIYREITCNPEAQGAQLLLPFLGKLGGRGPLRTKPSLAEHIDPPLKPGQVHHAISRTVYSKLEEHRILRGRYRPRDPRFVLRAATPEDHRGYQSWHRELDMEIVKWLERRKDATPEKFEAYLRALYERPELKRRFPASFEPIPEGPEK
ncbi:MAG: hypothetical protein JNJ46_32445, partial [Myxococcales bacterium]|nr:hypothetical protein [Myxococcales bacterium]